MLSFRVFEESQLHSTGVEVPIAAVFVVEERNDESAEMSIDVAEISKI